MNGSAAARTRRHLPDPGGLFHCDPGRLPTSQARLVLSILVLSGLVAAASCSPGEDSERAPNVRADLAVGRTPEGPLGASPEDGEGRVSIFPSGPIVAASWGSWTIEWIAGPSGLPPGGGVVLQVSPFWGWTPPQTRRPGFRGYSTVSSTNRNVRLSLAEGQVPMTLVCHVLEGPLLAGDTLRFVYGDSTRGGVGSLSRADIYAEEFEELLIKTDGNGDGYFAAVREQPSLRILAGPSVQLAISAPSVVEPGETFEVGIHALDAAGNWTELPAGELGRLLRPLAKTAAEVGALSPDTLMAGAHEPASAGAKRTERVEREGLFRLEAWLTPNGAGADTPGSAAPIRGRSDLLLVTADPLFRGVLWGDIHSHSALSDGTGSPRQLYAFAREVAGLDVACVTDHDAHGIFPLAEEGGFDSVRTATRDAYEPGRFVTLLGYEWTNWTFGHRNVYYPTMRGEVFSFLDPDSDTPEELWEKIRPFGGMTIPHHPAGGPVPIDWSIPSDEDRETVVEICSIHGSSEAIGIERGIYHPVPGTSVRDALRLGHKLGIIAAGDTHDGHPGKRTAGTPTNGLAAFWAEEKTRESVWSALVSRRVYGTSGARILLATDWGGKRPGSELTSTPEGPLSVHVVAPEPVEVIELIGPEGRVDSAYGGGRVVRRRFFESAAAPRTAWLYVRVVLADGEVAWDSPFWIEEIGS